MFRIQPRRLLVVAIALSAFIYVVMFVKPSSIPNASFYRSSVKTSPNSTVLRKVTSPPINKSIIRRVQPQASQNENVIDTEDIANKIRNIGNNLDRGVIENASSLNDVEDQFSHDVSRTRQNGDLLRAMLNESTEIPTSPGIGQKLERPYSRDTPRGEAWSDGDVIGPRDGAGSPTMIVIQAYMHTGSTYLGSVFQNHPGTYYSYEPLRSLQAMFRANDTTMFLNGTRRSYSGTWVTHPAGTEAVENMFLCRYDKLDMTTLVKYYFHIRSKAMRDQADFFRCLGRRQWYDTTKRSIQAHQARVKAEFFSPRSRARLIQCLPKVTDLCNAAQIRVSKFIRMTMDITEGLLPRLPGVKIIHLVRDPRAMLDSQVRKGDMGTRIFRVFVEETIEMCQRLLSDIRKRKQLEMLYPDSFKTIRYEDILDAPLASIKSLFEFTGVQFTQTDASYVKHYSVDTGQNSTARQATWRQHLDQAHIHVLNKHCNKVFERLGYIQYRNRADLKDLSKPTYLEKMH